MGAIQSTLTATIASGQTVGAAFFCGAKGPAALVMPAAFTGANISFQGSVDGSSYSAIISAGAAYSVAVAANQTVVLDPAVFAAFPYLKLVSDASEGGARSITVITVAAARHLYEAVSSTASSGTGFVKILNGVAQTPAATVGSSEIDPAVIQYAAVSVTAAEVKALNATPKTLVAAPAAGYVLEFISALLILDYGTAAYAGIGATEDLVIRYTNGSGAIVSTTLETTGLLDATSDQLRTFKGISTDLTPVAAAALVLHLLNGEVTTGDSPLRIKVAYRVHATGL